MRFTLTTVMAPLLLSLLASVGCEKYKVSTKGTSDVNKKVLFDFRAQRPSPPPRLNDAETQQIFAPVFPKYSPKTGTCKPTQAQATSRPQVLATRKGVFTETGKQQEAYLVEPGACEDDPSSFGEARLAIFSGTKLETVARVSANDIAETYDLDNDGLRELLLINRHEGEAGTVDTAHLLEFEKDTFRVIENFGRVFYESCKAKTGPSDSMTAVRLYYLPASEAGNTKSHNMPRFNVELYRAPCPAEGQTPQWKKVELNSSGT